METSLLPKDRGSVRLSDIPHQLALAGSASAGQSLELLATGRHVGLAFILVLEGRKEGRKEGREGGREG